MDEVSNTSARGDMMWRGAIVETCHRAFWIQGHRTEQTTHCAMQLEKWKCKIPGHSLVVVRGGRKEGGWPHVVRLHIFQP